MTWKINRAALVREVTDKINLASKQVQGPDDPLLDELATLQAYKRTLERAHNEHDFLDLAGLWQDQKTPVKYEVISR